MTRRPSLQGRLMAWTLGSLVVVWSAFVVAGYLAGVHEADELTDGHLASVASLLLAQDASSFDLRPPPAAPGIGPMRQTHDGHPSLSVVVWDGAGHVLARTGPAPMPSFNQPDGFATLRLGPDAAPWRVFARWDDTGHARKVAALLSLRERDGPADDIAAQVAKPGLWLLPIVTLVLSLAVRRGLRPLAQLSERVRNLDTAQGAPLVAPAHVEFQAMVQAIASLSARYRTALDHERELADAFAHALRTPLASLRLHANSLTGALTQAQRATARRHIVADAGRTAAIMTDLLALAHTGRAQLAEATGPVNLADLARQVAAEHAQRAFAGGHALAVEAPQACRVDGHSVLLEIALKNLVASALEHTPAGTAVEIHVQEGPPAAIQVRNNAPAPSERLQAGPAVPGLGLQVVRRVAAVHGGSFEIHAQDAQGWRACTITFGPGRATVPQEAGPPRTGAHA